VCRPKSVQCSGLQPQTCDDKGSWQNTATACPFLCNGGSCTGSCTPGAIRCSGAQPQTCSPTGAWANIGSACQACTVCSATTGTCAPSAAGTACDDGNACTKTDTCSAGKCVGSSPVACPTPDQCHTLGTCDPATGTCSKPPKPDNSSCSDSSSCTTTDVCTAGVCTPGVAMTCNAPDQCHTGPGTCDVTKGTCTYPAKADGSSCDADGTKCTQNDSCRAGVCTPGVAVACSSPDQCHMLPGTCNPANGSCSYMVKSEGSSCNADNDACTQNDFCHLGTCTVGARLACNTPPNVCNTSPGTCAAGTCTYGMKAENTACDLDASMCTKDVCKAGRCSTGTTVGCAAPGRCQNAVTCNPTTGTCPAPSFKGSGAADPACVSSATNCLAGGCDGSGGCLVKKAGASCGAGQTCTAGVQTAAQLCDGSGQCLAGAKTTCPPSGCNTTTNTCNPAKADGIFCISNADCSSGKCNTFYADNDHDLFPSAAQSVRACTVPPSDGSSPPFSHYIAARADGRFDCCDANKNANPDIKIASVWNVSVIDPECESHRGDANCDGKAVPDLGNSGLPPTGCVMTATGCVTVSPIPTGADCGSQFGPACSCDPACQTLVCPTSIAYQVSCL
jgi:hypothetical protein